jgi:hypothetical protein
MRTRPIQMIMVLQSFPDDLSLDKESAMSMPKKRKISILNYYTSDHIPTEPAPGLKLMATIPSTWTQANRF